MEIGQVYYCKNFPYQETTLKSTKSRPVLLLEEIDDERVYVMMLTTGYRKSKYDVEIKKSDIVDGIENFKVKKNTSRARVFITRIVYKSSITDYQFTISKEKINKILDMYDIFDKEKFKDPYNFRDWCTMANIKKLNDNLEDKIIFNLYDMVKYHEASCVDISIAVHTICKINDIDDSIGYVKWESKYNKTRGHMFTMFRDKGKIKCFHYLGDGYCVIDEHKITEFLDALKITCNTFEREIPELRNGHYEQFYMLLDENDMDYIDNLEERVTVKELFGNVIHDDVPILENFDIESMERVLIEE